MTPAGAQRKCHSFGAGPGSVTPGWCTTWQLARNQAGGMDATNHSQPSPNQSPPLENPTVGADGVMVWLLRRRRSKSEEADSSSQWQATARPPAHFTGGSSLESSLLPLPQRNNAHVVCPRAGGPRMEAGPEAGQRTGWHLLNCFLQGNTVAFLACVAFRSATRTALDLSLY